MENEILINLYVESMLSIADLAKKIAKSTPSVTKVVNQLIEQNIIVECGFAESTGGRRPIQYTINENSDNYILSIACDQYFTTISISDLQNKVIAEYRDIAVELKEKSSLDTILKRAEELIQKSTISLKNFIGIGVSIPGFVNSELGINESYPKAHGLFNLKRNIEKRFNIPTVIENDSRCIALAEKQLGIAKDITSSLIINLNWGVGLGIIINNTIFKGTAGYAGEFSHIPLADNQMLCSCGKRGCLEVVASLNAAIKYVENDIENEQYSIYSTFINSNDNKLEALFDSIRVGDQVAINNIGKIGYMLGKGISTLIHILNPKQILISGRGAEVGHILEPHIQIALNEFCIPEIAKTTHLAISELHKDAQIKGTMCLVVENLIHRIFKSNYTQINQ
ncbi:N-acetylglucosamine repressor [Sphingobacterium zeae]|uniref:N-acetylglucosamine repressor n=1 Tax=Sphingobacterium zeae TaxID=1776859 RepID=A0ABU0UBW2_9SPHI|nr:ROK family protein [Sphingobacterium zeae]MDQ1152345.1 N-acetylglucosamine repressor [Sphingobacterium zeae]